MITTSDIFKGGLDFEQTALEIFHIQARKNEVYQQFLYHLKKDVASVQQTSQIPFLPIRFFKSHPVITGQPGSGTLEFTSSGTTGSTTSIHYVTDIQLYEQSFLNGFARFYGAIEDYCLIALLPSYLERGGSSLIYMCDALIAKSKHPLSGFYLDQYDTLSDTLRKLEAQKQKTILLGVTYALLDFAAKYPMPLSHTTIMETGGMKGKRVEMIKNEIQEILQNAFSANTIHSEYGMTELLSQAYSSGNGIYRCPPWMKVLVRDAHDPLSLLPSQKTGGLNIIDLANMNSCSFIATQDLGKVYEDGSFEVLGRFDDAEIRGCNLMVD